MNVALIAIEGVLRKMVGGQPIPEGRRLYVSLANTGRIILVEDDGFGGNQEWLELNGFVQHDFTVYGSDVEMLANRLRREGYDVDLVIVPDPVEAQQLISSGINTMLFTHAQYSHPEWRPDTDSGVRPWDDITKQVADLARAKAKDARLKGDD